MMFNIIVGRVPSMNKQFIFVNGQFVEKDKAVISIYDHGFLYGDGVFEGIRVYEGNVYKLKEHIERLYDSAHSIMLVIPHTKEELRSEERRVGKKSRNSK